MSQSIKQEVLATKEKVVRVPLTQGKQAIIDAEDAKRVLAHTWHAKTNDGSAFYARGALKQVDKTWKMVYMHRFILGVSDRNIHVDHINGDPLDNRKENLKPTTCKLNARRKHKRTSRQQTSQYKGVCFRKDARAKNRWRAHICINYEKKCLGHFSTEIAAAKAYDQAAKKLHGEYAALNFPRLEHDFKSPPASS
jgi:hypothetical protein